MDVGNVQPTPIRPPPSRGQALPAEREGVFWASALRRIRRRIYEADYLAFAEKQLRVPMARGVLAYSSPI
jgi:hypothetical protein